MSHIEHWTCETCGGTGSVRVYSHEDYGVSFECEACERCGGTGKDVGAMQAALDGGVGAVERMATALANLLEPPERTTRHERVREAVEALDAYNRQRPGGG